MDPTDKKPETPALLKTVSDTPSPLKVRLATIARSLVVLAVIGVVTVCYFA